jgi:DNA polymerase III epsilon subunit-like protein
MTTPHTEPDHAMVDLETLGTQPFSPILSIGACAFSMDDEPIVDVFYQPIDVESCLELGMRPSGDTIKWWMQQEEGARASAFHDPEQVTLPLALDAFTDWINSRPLIVCGNSTRFDCGLLEAAYKVCRKEVPWQWWKEGCYRAIKNLPAARGIKLERFGTHHNALDDAISQAVHMRKIYRALGLTQVAAAAA